MLAIFQARLFRIPKSNEFSVTPYLHNAGSTGTNLWFWSSSLSLEHGWRRQESFKKYTHWARSSTRWKHCMSVLLVSYTSSELSHYCWIIYEVFWASTLQLTTLSWIMLLFSSPISLPLLGRCTWEPRTTRLSRWFFWSSFLLQFSLPVLAISWLTFGRCTALQEMAQVRRQTS